MKSFNLSHKAILLIMILTISNSIAHCQCRKKVKTENENFLLRNYSRENIKIDFWQNVNSIDSSSNGIIVLFGIGIDKPTTFKIFLNDKIVKSIDCRTNYSIGYCTDSLKHIANAFIAYSKIEKNDSLKIIYNKKYFIIKIPPTFRLYNKIKIFNHNGWNATFMKDNSQYILE